jgi:hypothetical protein
MPNPEAPGTSIALTLQYHKYISYHYKKWIVHLSPPSFDKQAQKNQCIQYAEFRKMRELCNSFQQLCKEIRG